MPSPQEPLILFYDLLGTKTWSPFCWNTRFVLNYKGIPYKTTILSFPDIEPTCEKLFGDLEAQKIEATIPIIETLPSNTHPTIPQAKLNNSVPIAKFLNQFFTPDLGFRYLEGVEEGDRYNLAIVRYIFRWIVNDVYENVLKGDERGQEFFKRTREANNKCSLAEITDVKGGGEEKLLADIREVWAGLRERMAKEDGNGEPTYVDFQDAMMVKWIEAASAEKFEKLLDIYGDDTFVKLRKKTEKYAY